MITVPEPLRSPACRARADAARAPVEASSRRIRRARFGSGDIVARFRACAEGAAILEFAVVLPIAVAILAGGFEVGRALFNTLTVERAVRAGARYLARVPDPTCTPACSRGARRAIDLARSQILSSTGLAPDAVRVSIVEDGPARTVVMRAEAVMGLVLLQNAGFPTSWTITVRHQEQQVEE